MIEYLKTHPKVTKRLVLGYIVFAGCFTFPIGSERFPLDWQKAYLLVASYGVIALSFAGLDGPKREKRVYMQTLVFTVLGLLCRYLLEFGEVSNTYNFTPVNIISYLLLIPLGTVLAYAHLSRKVLRKDKEGE